MSNERIFEKVFVGGDKNIGRVPDKVAQWLDDCIERRESILISDENTLPLQAYLKAKNYRKVRYIILTVSVFAILEIGKPNTFPILPTPMKRISLLLATVTTASLRLIDLICLCVWLSITFTSKAKPRSYTDPILIR